jgi:GT2 family glycosyltransferase
MADMDYDAPQTVEWAIGALLFANRNLVWDRFGGFDESYFMYYEDTDLAWRMNLAGLRVYYQPAIEATHVYRRESASRMISRLKLIHLQSMVRFLRRKSRARPPETDPSRGIRE